MSSSNKGKDANGSLHFEELRPPRNVILDPYLPPTLQWSEEEILIYSSR